MSLVLALAGLPGRPTAPGPAPSLSGPVARVVAEVRSHAVAAALAGSGPDACPWPAGTPALLWRRRHREAREELDGRTARRTSGTTD